MHVQRQAVHRILVSSQIDSKTIDWNIDQWQTHSFRLVFILFFIVSALFMVCLFDFLFIFI